MEARKIQLPPELERITVKSKPAFEFTKRFIDVVGVLVALLFFLPLFIIIAILIKLDDPSGKVFFSQTRVGKDQKKFSMYKFRTMYPNAEQRLEELLKFNEVEGAMFKMKEDPRITKIGKYLRQYSLDELPQLFNVLFGTMSLVGPRPPLIREVVEYTPYDKQRLLVKPGITGLWQVSGRNSLSFQQMVELDLKYIQTNSILNDIKILLRTIVVIVRGSDAY